MTKNNIIRMAREAGLTDESFERDWYIFQLERFAALVAEHERKACAEQYTAIMRDAVAKEREACAHVAEDWDSDSADPRDVAVAIRARGSA